MALYTIICRISLKETLTPPKCVCHGIEGTRREYHVFLSELFSTIRVSFNYSKRIFKDRWISVLSIDTYRMVEVYLQLSSHGSCGQCQQN